MYSLNALRLGHCAWLLTATLLLLLGACGKAPTALERVQELAGRSLRFVHGVHLGS